MEDYIDMHCHILSEIDDGAQNDAEMERMLKIAYKNGIRYIIATPHIHPTKGNISIKRIKEKLSRARKIAYSIDGNFKIYLGSEIYFHQEVPSLLRNHKLFTINNSRYILIEFASYDSYFYIRQSLQQLRNTGYKIILAHVERYSSLLTNFEFAIELFHMGILFQVNAKSICGKNRWKVKKFITFLLEKDMVFCVGTDAHNSKDRAPKIRKAVKYITYYYGKNTTRRIFFSNAMKLLKNI